MFLTISGLFFRAVPRSSCVSTIHAPDHLEILHQQYCEERQRANTQIFVGLFLVLMIGLALIATILIFLYSGQGIAPVPAIFRAGLFFLSGGSLLIGLVFTTRAFFWNDAGEMNANRELVLNPAMVRIGAKTQIDQPIALQNQAAAYTRAIDSSGRKNEDQRRELSLTGWCLGFGVLFAMILLSWSLVLNPAGQGNWFSGANSRRPAEISQDRSAIPLPAVGTPTAAHEATPESSEIDGACCLFEDRRPTR